MIHFKTLIFSQPPSSVGTGFWWPHLEDQKEPILESPICNVHRAPQNISMYIKKKFIYIYISMYIYI